MYFVFRPTTTRRGFLNSSNFQNNSFCEPQLRQSCVFANSNGIIENGCRTPCAEHCENRFFCTASNASLSSYSRMWTCGHQILVNFSLAVFFFIFYSKNPLCVFPVKWFFVCISKESEWKYRMERITAICGSAETPLISQLRHIPSPSS